MSVKHGNPSTFEGLLPRQTSPITSTRPCQYVFKNIFIKGLCRLCRQRQVRVPSVRRAIPLSKSTRLGDSWTDSVSLTSASLGSIHVVLRGLAEKAKGEKRDRPGTAGSRTESETERDRRSIVAEEQAAYSKYTKALLFD